MILTQKEGLALKSSSLVLGICQGQNPLYLGPSIYVSTLYSPLMRIDVKLPYTHVHVRGHGREW